MVTESLFSTSFRSLMLLGRLSWTLFFIIFQAFSIGLRSGEFPGHSKTGIFWSLRNSLSQYWHYGLEPRHAWSECIGEFSENSVNALPKKLCSFHCNILRKKVQPSPTLISIECSPHDHTIRVFNSLNRVPRDTEPGGRTVFYPALNILKVLSSLNITFFHCSDVQCPYFLQKLSLFSLLLWGEVSLRLGDLVDVSLFIGGVEVS